MRALQILLVILQCCACGAVAWRGLASRFPAFLAYLAGSAVRGVALAQYVPTDRHYLDVWLVTLPVVTLLQIATAIEAYRHSLEELPGARRYSHWLIIVASVLAAALVQIPQKTFSAFGVLSLAQQAVATVLAVAAIGLATLVTYLRPLRRPNAVIHERILALHFTALAAMLGLVNTGTLGWTSPANVVMSILCCVAWSLLLTQEGERMPHRPPGGPPAAEGDLASLRARLTRLLRR